MISRSFAAIGAATALVLSTLATAPAIAVPAKPAKPVLTCKLKAADGLTYSVIKPGKGEKPGATSKVEVNYTGRLAADGTEFDAGKAAKFPVGGVIPGFAQGLQLMQPGGSYRLCIPAAIGYGAAGSGPIPANADLVFEVDLLSFTTPPPKPVIAPADRTCAQTTASGLGYALVKPGTGRAPTDADLVLVDYSLFDAATGTVQNQQLWDKIPVAQASAMFGEALKMMQVGSTYRFCPGKPAATEGAEAVNPNILITLIDVRVAPETD